MVRLRWIGMTAALLGCNGAEDVREWQPSDHHHNTMAAQAGQVPEAPASAEPVRPGLEEVTLVTWRRNCTTCHGPLGRGDGPQAPMTKPRDLADPTWQASVTDDAIALAIRNGTGRMPAFQLPDATIQSLVKLIRLLGGQGRPGAGATGNAPAPGAAPSTTAPPSAASSATAPPPSPGPAKSVPSASP